MSDPKHYPVLNEQDAEQQQQQQQRAAGVRRLSVLAGAGGPSPVDVPAQPARHGA